MLSKEASMAILDLSEWFAMEKLIEFTEEYERGDRDKYPEMVRMEETIKVLKNERQRIKSGRAG